MTTEYKLYNKYRPKNLRTLLGQDSALKQLKSMFKTKRIAQAFLISGPYGTGKTSLARIIAKYVNCENPDAEGAPCEKCPYCTNFNNNKSDPSIQEFNAAKTRGIDDIRSLLDITQFGVRSKYRIIIIDEVHMLTPQAFQVLLKPLEEPPKKCIFILCTTELQKVPRTIASRTTKINLHLVDSKSIAKRLFQIIGKETKYKMTSTDALMLAEAANGHVRDAIESIEPLVNIILAEGAQAKDIKEHITSYISEALHFTTAAVIQALLLTLYTSNYKKLFTALGNVEGNKSYLLEQVIQYHIKAIEYLNKGKKNPMYTQWYTALDKYILIPGNNCPINNSYMSKVMEKFTDILGQMKSYLVDDNILFYNAFLSTFHYKDSSGL